MRDVPPSWSQQLLATAAGIALVAVAISFAVHIIISVWVPLVIIGLVFAGLTALGWVIRNRSRGW